MPKLRKKFSSENTSGHLPLKRGLLVAAWRAFLLAACTWLFVTSIFERFYSFHACRRHPSSHGTLGKDIMRAHVTHLSTKRCFLVPMFFG